MSIALRNPVIADFEFCETEVGGTPIPHTLCALEISTGKAHRYGPAELAEMQTAPFPEDHTLIAFSADAERAPCNWMTGIDRLRAYEPTVRAAARGIRA